MTRSEYSTLAGDLVLRVSVVVLPAVLLFHLVAFATSSERLLAWDDAAFMPLLLVLCCWALRSRWRDVSSATERAFWNYLTVAMLLWLAGEVLRLTAAFDLASDFLYLLFFLSLIAASEVRPDEVRDSHSFSPVQKIDLTAVSLFGLGLLFYFVLVPRYFAREEDAIFLVEGLMYAIVDVYLIVWFGYLSLASQPGKWRLIYRFIAAAALLWFAADFSYYLFVSVDSRQLSPSAWVEDVFWYTSAGAFILAARLRHLPSPSVAAPLEVELRTADTHPSRHWIPVVAYAFLLPCLHLFFGSLGILGREQQRDKDALLLVYMVLLGILVLLRQRAQGAANERLRREAERQRQEIATAEKMISLGTIVSGVAHEINNPNHFIMLNVPILRDAWRDAQPILDEHHRKNPDLRLANLPYEEMREEVPELIGDILHGADRIKLIVSELRSYSRGGSPRSMAQVRMNKVVQSALTLLASPIKKASTRFSVHYADDLPDVYGNVGRLEQVVIDLLLNACQALTRRDQAISLVTDHEPETGRVLVTVSDEGRGIPEADLGRILDPFFTTKREAGGTGLGLAFAARIVDEHKGRLTFESTVGRGTTARLVLPVWAGEMANEAPAGV